jgi:hypothetical protein
MDNTDNLTKKRETRILKKKGTTAGGAKILKVEKRKAKVKAIPKKIGTAVKKTVGAALLAPLLPFKGAMVKELQHKGVNTSKMSFKEIVVNFYNTIVSKKADKFSSFEEVNVSEFINDEAFSTPLNESDSIAGIGTAIEVIVSAIINIFKNAKVKREAAKASGMSEKEYKASTKDEDVRLGEAADEVTKKLEVKELEDSPAKKVDIKKILIIIAVLGAVYFLIKFVSKKK